MKLTLMGLMAIQYLNAPYRWAANGPFEFDCSGLVLKVLHDVGITLPDMTAQSLYDYCVDRGRESSLECDSLLFFGKSTEDITHVAIALGEMNGTNYMLESGGAGISSQYMTMEELAERDARVRIKPVNLRRDLVASIKLPYIKE